MFKNSIVVFKASIINEHVVIFFKYNLKVADLSRKKAREAD